MSYLSISLLGDIKLNLGCTAQDYLLNVIHKLKMQKLAILFRLYCQTADFLSLIQGKETGIDPTDETYSKSTKICQPLLDFCFLFGTKISA